MKIVTVLNDFSNRGFNDFLMPSCGFYRLDATALEYEGIFFSNRIKDIMLYDFLETLDEEEIVLFTDATDAVFVSGENEILDKYKKFNSDLVFSAEINCWPDNSLERGYPVRADIPHFKYLNSGGFIGRAGFIKSIYATYPIFETGKNDRFIWSNQYYWNTIFINEWPTIKLDYEGAIFYTTCIPTRDNDILISSLQCQDTIDTMFSKEKNRLDTELPIIDGRAHSTITKSAPCHIHFPGTISKLLMEKGYFDRLKKW